MKRVDTVLAIGGLTVLVALMVGVLGYTAISRPQGSATAPFELQATTGEAIDQTVFKGQPSLLYFGYTHCPEVCPTTLVDMTQWLEMLGPDADRLQSFFFTVDPKRDTLDVMGPYVSAFSPRIVGVTGDEAEMRKVTDAWLVTAEQRGSEDDYSMRHMTSIYLIGANGRLAGLIPYGTEPEAAVAKIRDVLLSGSATASRPEDNRAL